jgi:uncharacterized RDD family membrane protein YckC
MQWYYAVGDQRQGPVEHAEFERLVSNGTIKSDTLVWRQGMSAWQAYSAVVGAPAVGTAVDDGTEVCAVSGKRYPRRDMINYEGKWISAEHRDQYFQRLREGVAQPGEAPVPGPFGYAGFWRRFVARMLDGFIQGFVLAPIVIGGALMIGTSTAVQQGNTGAILVFQLLIQLFAMGVGLAYDIFFIRKYDATPGKLAMGARLLRPDGSKLSIARIIGRYFAHLLIGFTLLIGYIMAAFDAEKRALHDRICDTRVVKTR